MTAKDDLQGAAGISIGQALEVEQDEQAEADTDEYAADTGPARVDVREMADPGDPGTHTAAEESWTFDIPPMVAQYLKPDEARVIPVRQHIARLLVPAIAFAGGLLAAVALNAWAYSAGRAAPDVVHVLWIGWMIAAGWSLWRYMIWRQTWFIVTGHRVMMIETSPWLSRRVTMLPIDKLRDMEYTQSLTGRVFGFGTFRFTSIGTERALQEVRFLPWPEWIYQQISELTMPTPERKAMKRNR